MVTRKKVFEDRHPLRIHYVVDGVMFENFPASQIDGTIGLPSSMLEVAERIASEIPDNLKPAVTIDFSKVDGWTRHERILVEQGIVAPEEHTVGEAEIRLMEMLGYSYDEQTQTFHPEEEEADTETELVYEE